MPSAIAMVEAVRPYSEFAWVWFIELRHAQLPNPIRLCNSNVPKTYNSNEYQNFAFDVKYPDLAADELPTSTLVVGLVEGADDTGGSPTNLINLIRSIPTRSDPIKIDISLVIMSTPEELFFEATDMAWLNLEWSHMAMKGDLEGPLFLLSPLQAANRRATPATIPGQTGAVPIP